MPPESARVCVSALSESFERVDELFHARLVARLAVLPGLMCSDSLTVEERSKLILLRHEADMVIRGGPGPLDVDAKTASRPEVLHQGRPHAPMSVVLPARLGRAARRYLRPRMLRVAFYERGTARSSAWGDLEFEHCRTVASVPKA